MTTATHHTTPRRAAHSRQRAVGELAAGLVPLLVVAGVTASRFALPAMYLLRTVVVYALMATLNPGDEVVVFEPFYENYGPDAVLSQASPVFLPLEAPDYRVERDRLEAVVTPKTRAIVVNTPNNPTGRVFDRDELQAIADICREYDILAITDEIYEHIYYESEHLVLAGFEGMRDRTITVSGLSKTFSVTGWRVGTIMAPPHLTDAIRKVHDFLTVGAPAPLQEACAVGLRELGQDYYTQMVERYKERRGVLLSALQAAGFGCTTPQGAYYVLADFSGMSDEDVAELISTSWLLLAPSLYEGFGIPTVEALNQRTAVVASWNPGNRYFRNLAHPDVPLVCTASDEDYLEAVVDRVRSGPALSDAESWAADDLVQQLKDASSTGRLLEIYGRARR